MKICIVGAGSIGQRHIKNFLESNSVAQIHVVEPNINLWANSEVDYETSLSSTDFDGAIICTPTHLHAECALPFLKQDIPVLIEKPLAHSIGSAHSLYPYRDLIQVGYTMRYDESTQTIKNHLPEIGTPLLIEAEVGQYLPDWHPNEDYRNWYIAHRSQGGGAALDLSHEIDTIQYLMDSRIESANGFSIKKHPDLEIDSDDLTIFHGYLRNGVCFRLQMNLLDRRYYRSMKVIGSEDTIDWSRAGMVQVGGKELLFNVDRNYQFLDEEADFLNWIKGENVTDLASFESASHTLRVAIGIRDNGSFQA